MVAGFFILAFLILLSSFFSSMETAYFSLGEMEEENLRNAKLRRERMVARLLGDKEKLLSAILIGNNLTNIAASAINTMLAVSYSYILNISPEMSVTLFAGGLTLVILMFGEILPKYAAIHFNRSMAIFFAPLLFFLVQALSPLAYFFRIFIKGVNRLFNKPTNSQRIDQEVRRVASSYAKKTDSKSKGYEIIENVFYFREKSVSSVITPRMSVFALQEDLRISDAIQILLEKNFSRVPVYKESIDEISGILNLKKAFRSLTEKRDETLANLSDKPVFVYETMPILTLFEQMKKEQIHMACAVDEFGGLLGIATLEDILEEIVGDIFDEKDVAQEVSQKIKANHWSLPGRIDIHSLNKEIGSDIEISDQYDTLQGWIMQEIQNLPLHNERVQKKGYTFTVKKMRKNEILLVHVEKDPFYRDEDEEEIEDM